MSTFADARTAAAFRLRRPAMAEASGGCSLARGTVRAPPQPTAYLRYQRAFGRGGLIVRERRPRTEPDHIAAWEADFASASPCAAVSGALCVQLFALTNSTPGRTIDTVGLPSTINSATATSFARRTGRVRALPVAIPAWRAPGTEAESPTPTRGLSLSTSRRFPSSDFKLRGGIDSRRKIGPFCHLQLSGWANYVGESTLGIGPILGRDQ